MNFFRQLARRLQEGLRALSPDCNAASRLQSDTLDRPLPFFRRAGLWIHLLLCRGCRRYGRQLRWLRRALREQPDQVTEAMPHALSPEAQARLKRALREEPKP